MNGLLTNIRTCYKEMGAKVSWFAGFCHHNVATMSVHIHAYHCPLFESVMKIGLWTIVLSRKDIALLYKHKEQQ